MKKTNLILLLFLAAFTSFKTTYAQDNLKVETFYLDNGLKVVLCEEHSAPIIHGTVYVHAGSKNDPLDATGMAHYFEHIMFKGTDKIGTIDWEKEKVYLDSIDIMYDKLHDTDIPKERQKIQQKINELSIASTDYAIPNEVDLILTKMGGDGLNAGTAYDQTMYYNFFPSNQLEKWMDVYVERFRYPVFRLFQSELETVYEEKNMYSDDMMNAFSEAMFKECFGEHPYGRPVIGLTEHLKNPQTSKMREFFNTYYVANNMTLILVGDLNIDEVKPLVEEKFSAWERKELPKEPDFKVPALDEKVVKKEKLTPVKMGAVLYKGINNSHEDLAALNVLSYIISNESTGIFDELMLNNKLLAAMFTPLPLEDHGAIVMMYVPKLLGQSHEKAETILFEALDKVKSGNFSDELFEAAKTTILKEMIEGTEGIGNIAETFLELEWRGMSYQDYLNESEVIKNLTKEDIVEIANKYITDNYTALRSGMGFPKKDKVDKPNWKPVDVKNTELKSEFAKSIENKHVSQVKPQVIEYGKDVVIEKANDAFTIYSNKNPYNNIFSLKINYNYGLIDNPDLAKSADLLTLLGTETMTFEELELELQRMGAMIYFNVSDGVSSLTISGFDEHFEEIMAICEDKIFNTKFEKEKMDLMIETQKMETQTDKTSSDTWSNALFQYVLYGENSIYLNKTDIKEWAKQDEEEILGSIRDILNYGGTIEFTGNVDTKTVINSLNAHNLIKDNAIKAEKKIKERNTFDENMVYFIHNSDFRQSKIDIYVPGEKLNHKEAAQCDVFNKYFGTDMFSIVFQEIRELRSLGYAAYSYYQHDKMNRIPGNLYAFLGTQSDKTNEAVEEMCKLILDMPEKTEKFSTSKNALILSNAADYITPRDIPASVISWTDMGFDHDPRIETTNFIKETSFDDIYKFYQSKIQNRPVIIMITGNEKEIDLKALEKFGKVQKLKFKQIYK